MRPLRRKEIEVLAASANLESDPTGFVCAVQQPALFEYPSAQPQQSPS